MAALSVPEALKNPPIRIGRVFVRLCDGRPCAIRILDAVHKESTIDPDLIGLWIAVEKINGHNQVEASPREWQDALDHGKDD